MASICNDPNGRRRILFVAGDGSRKAIRLGKCDRKTAESICRHVESLLGAKIGRQPIPRDTAVWLSEVDDNLRDKLAAVGLIVVEQKQTVAEFLAKWLADRKVAGYKTASLIAWGQTATEMSGLFGQRTLASLTHSDGENYRDAMQQRGLRATTIHKRLGHARQMLEDAVRLDRIPTNPWKHVRHRQGDASERRAYVPVGHALRVIDHCPNVWWRLLVALARFGGLRTPSEPFSMTWGDIDWERGRVSVPSPKTEGSGKTHRVIPMFPLLRPHLEAAFAEAEQGSIFVMPIEYRRRALGPSGWRNANLRTTLQKVIRRAGVDPWPRLWHSLRASCESDLAQSFPLAVVTKWLGNTPSVALRHYVDPTEVAYTQANSWIPGGGAESGAQVAQNQAQHIAADNGRESQSSTENEEGEALTASPCDIMREPEQTNSGGGGNRTRVPSHRVDDLYVCS